jgi:hypothetical protein
VPPFRRAKPDPPELPTTGHAGDDALLAQIVGQGGDLDTPRHWVHYLYLPDEARGRSAAEVIAAAGWEIRRVDVSPGSGLEWMVIVERHDAITSPTAVREARTFLDAVATTHDGEYDGWEASI